MFMFRPRRSKMNKEKYEKEELSDLLFRLQRLRDAGHRVDELITITEDRLFSVIEERMFEEEEE